MMQHLFFLLQKAECTLKNCVFFNKSLYKSEKEA